MPKKISVMLVDDHSLVRRGFRRIIEDESDLEVVGEAGNGEESIPLALRLRPRVIVLVATQKILETAPETAILMLSMHSEDTLVRQAMAAGARGYILKNAIDLELVDAIRRVAAGEKVLASQLTREPGLKGERGASLTARELEVLQLIVSGKSNKEIASQLDLSVNTVAVHRANIMDTLGIHKTAELVVYAIRHGLVSVP
jgi:DNA-binding NarL/FixJ family response regulator